MYIDACEVVSSFENGQYDSQRVIHQYSTGDLVNVQVHISTCTNVYYIEYTSVAKISLSTIFRLSTRGTRGWFEFKELNAWAVFMQVLIPNPTKLWQIL